MRRCGNGADWREREVPPSGWRLRAHRRSDSFEIIFRELRQSEDTDRITDPLSSQPAFHISVHNPNGHSLATHS